MLLPHADIATETLAAGLEERGWEVDDVTAYRTVRAAPPAASVREAIKGGGFDAVCFTSSSTVRNLVGIAGKPHAKTVVAVIGPRHGRQRPGVRPARRRAARDRRRRPAGRRPGRVRPVAARVGGRRGQVSRPAGGQPRFARGRRLRSTPALRRLTAQTRLAPADLVLPVFVKEGIAEPVPIGSMPGVVQHSLDSLRKAAHEAAEAGIGGLMLFGIPAEKDAVGSQADAADGIVNVALQQLRGDLGDELVLMADLCLCEYTDHGHCGVVTPAGVVDNDPTLDRYAAVAIAQAQAGAHLVAPSGMMDGQVAAIRAGAGQRRLHRDADPGLRRQVRLGLLRPVPRGRRGRAAVRRPLDLPDGPAQRRRGAARGGAGPRRGRRRRHGQARAALPGHRRAGSPTRCRCR